METDREKHLIFSRLKTLLEMYRPPLVAKAENDKRFDLVSIKDVVIGGKKRPEVFFASIIIQKRYVGFYFMPVYTDPEMTKFFPPELLSLLKGKSCFHIKRLDDGLLEQLKTALENGFTLYKGKGWLWTEITPNTV